MFISFCVRFVALQCLININEVNNPQAVCYRCNWIVALVKRICGHKNEQNRFRVNTTSKMRENFKLLSKSNLFKILKQIEKQSNKSPNMVYAKIQKCWFFFLPPI